MKKLILILLMFLLLTTSLFAYSSLGGGCSYILMATPRGASSQGVNVVVNGNNFFGQNQNFGIEYAFNQPFLFGEEEGKYQFNIDVSALYKFIFTKYLNLDVKVGLDFNYRNGVVAPSFQEGLLLGCNFNYKIIKHLGLSLSAEYILPLLREYQKTMKFVPFDMHLFRFALGVSFLY